MLIPQRRTIVTLEDLVPAFARSFEAAAGMPPEVIDCALIYGKLVMECGHPGPTQCCWTFNVGNIRGRSPAGDWTILGRAYEIALANAIPPGWHVVPNTFGAAVPAGSVCILPDDPRRQEFRAYPTLQVATDDYVAVLGAHFNRTWHALVDHDTRARGLVEAMKVDHYYTGSLEAYVATVGSVARSVITRVEALLGQAATERTFEVLATLEGGPATPLRVDPGSVFHTPTDDAAGLTVNAGLPDLSKGSE